MPAVIAIAISALALMISFITLLDRRRNDRRDLFLGMHERLIELELRHGREVLAVSVTSAQSVVELHSYQNNDYELACKALSMLDVAALYVERGYISRSLFVEEWGSVYSSLKGNVEWFIEGRELIDREHLTWTWPHFRVLADEISKLSPSAFPPALN